jgi:hypothetical protein
VLILTKTGWGCILGDFLQSHQVTLIVAEKRGYGGETIFHDLLQFFTIRKRIIQNFRKAISRH